MPRLPRTRSGARLGLRGSDVGWPRWSSPGGRDMRPHRSASPPRRPVTTTTSTVVGGATSSRWRSARCASSAPSSIDGWLRWVLVVGAFILPYVAVVMANVASPRIDGHRPRPARARPPGDRRVSDLPDGPDGPTSARRKGCQASCRARAALEQPQAAHPRTPQGLARLRRAPPEPGRLPLRPEVPPGDRAPLHPSVDGLTSRRWRTSAGWAGGRSRRRCRGRAAWSSWRGATGRRSRRRSRRRAGPRRRSDSSRANRQLRTWPSAVRRTRSQSPQNGPGDRGDHADLGGPAVDEEGLGRRAPPVLADRGSA